MIAQNARIANIEGTFQKISRQHVGLEAIAKIEKDFETMLASAHTEANVAAICAVRDRMIREVKASNGIITAQERYSGVLDTRQRFDVTISRQSANGGEFETRSISNGVRGMQYSPMTYTTILGDPQKASTAIGRDSSNLFNVRQWMMRPNQIASTEKTSILTSEQFDGSTAIILQQKPTDYSLNKYIIRYTVLPEKGFLAAATEFIDVATNEVIRSIESKDLVEVAPGVWRPRRIIDTRYKMGKGVIDTQTEIVVAVIDAINQEVPDARFEFSIPEDTKTIVDETQGLEMEYESPTHADGIDSIIDGLALADSPPGPPRAPVIDPGDSSNASPGRLVSDRQTPWYTSTWFIWVFVLTLFAVLSNVIARVRKRSHKRR